MDPKQPALVILMPGFPESEADTTCLPERQVMIRALKRNFPLLDIIVLALHYPYKTRTYTWYNVKIISFNGRNKGKLNRLPLWYNVWKSLKQIEKEQRIIGMISFWLNECAVLGKYFAKRHGFRNYCWLLGQDAKKGNRWVKLLRPKPGSLIALSDFLVEEFERNYNIRPMHLISPGVEAGLFSHDHYQREIDILGVGSLIPLKQYDLFVQIIKSLTGIFPGIKAVICGKGPEKQQLSLLINELSIEKNLTLLDEIPHEQVLHLMQRSKLLLHPSAYEGFSTVCLEALYAGAHVVSFCKPMHNDIRHFNIVASKEEMLEKTLNILQDNNREHERVFAFCADNAARQVMRLFDYEILANGINGTGNAIE